MSTAIPWSCETNWVINHGSLKDSVTVESSDDPIDESVPENPVRKQPLILKPIGPDSGPCEIKICFEKKYEVGQIYVRSTGRTYEIYCTHSAHRINDYLCTVRCGVAERDEKVLQTNYIEDVVHKHGEGPSEEVNAENVTDGSRVVGGEDDWINIKVPKDGTGFSSDKISTNGFKNVQDFYEATAEISDSEPCLSLTIRLLSLQGRGHVYIDEIYVFVDPVESIDSGNEAVLAGSSAQSSLMAMFMPTLLQLSKSGINRVQDKCASNEVLKDGKMETTSRIIDQIDSHQQYVKPKELDKVTPESSKLKDTAESSEQQQHTCAKKSAEHKDINDISLGRLEMALEQLISRISRVEETCLRFEEKMLKPIESIEARLHQVENKLEKLARNAHDFGFPHCTRISAPAFSCSKSNSSSLCNDQSDYPPLGALDLEQKDFSCTNMPGFSRDPNFHPSLVITAPEFSGGEAEEDNDELKPLNDSPCIEPKKTLSLDEALAASLNGFLCTAASNPSEHIQTTLGLSSQVNEENQDQRHADSSQTEAEESTDADNGNKEPSEYALALTVNAPVFTVEETSNEEEQLSYTMSSFDMVSIIENEDESNQIVPSSMQSNCLFTSRESSDFCKSKSTDDLGSACNGDLPVLSVNESETCLGEGNRHLNKSPKANMIESYFEGCSAGISNGAHDLANEHQISNESNPLEKSTSFNRDDHPDDASEEVLGHASEDASDILQQFTAFVKCFNNHTPINISESSHGTASLLDLQFPILEVKFASDRNTSTNHPLEALLGGAVEPDASDDDGHIEQNDDVIREGNGTTDVLPICYPLVDVGVSAADGCLNSEGISHYVQTPSSPGLKVSLI